MRPSETRARRRGPLRALAQRIDAMAVALAVRVAATTVERGLRRRARPGARARAPIQVE